MTLQKKVQICRSAASLLNAGAFTSMPTVLERRTLSAPPMWKSVQTTQRGSRIPHDQFHRKRSRRQDRRGHMAVARNSPGAHCRLRLSISLTCAPRASRSRLDCPSSPQSPPRGRQLIRGRSTLANRRKHVWSDRSPQPDRLSVPREQYSSNCHRPQCNAG